MINNHESLLPKLKFKKSISLLFIFSLLIVFFFNPSNLFASTKINKQNSTTPFSQIVAQKYGINNFSKVKTIAFTFNVKIGKKYIVRSWYWEPGTHKITYKGPGKDGKEMNYSYYENKVDKKDSLATFVDAKFINDQYWLLFPFHLVWDKKVNIKDAGSKPYPISKKNAHCLIVKYPDSAGGYTPGDIFELYVGKDDLIHEWVYMPGGNAAKKRIMTWEKNKDFNGILISTEHNGPDHNFKLWFTGIKVVTQ